MAIYANENNWRREYDANGCKYVWQGPVTCAPEAAQNALRYGDGKLSANGVDHRLYARCTDREIRADRCLEIRCKLGLWATAGGNHAAVEIEARHYWTQYFNAREYDKLLANP